MADEATPRVPPRRRRFLKRALYASGGLVLVAAGVVAYLLATFDPRDYHAHVVALVKEKTGRTLSIDGDVALSFWPDLAVRLGALRLSERNSSEAFASIESARVRLETVPLLSRELVASELVLSGARVRITRDPTGRLNIDDLLQGEGPPPRFDIGRVEIDRSALVYDDQASGARYEIDALRAETGRLANGIGTPVKLAFNARAPASGSSLAVSASGRVKPDLERRHHVIEQARVTAKGRTQGLGEVALKLSGGAVVDAASSTFRFAPLALAAEGTYGHDALALAVDATSVTLVPGRAVGESVRVALDANGPAGTTKTVLALPSVVREGDRVRSEAARLELALARGTHRVEGTLTSALEAAIAARTLAVTSIASKLEVRGPRLPAKGIAATLNGDAQLDARAGGVVLRLHGRVDDSAVKARVEAAGLASPVYSFAVHIDRLDLGRYVRTAPSAARTARRDRIDLSDEPLLAPLFELPASGTIEVGVLRNASVDARNVRLTLK